MSTRKRRSPAAGISSLTGAQAQYVLTQLLKTRSISAHDVRWHLDNLNAQINALEAQLRSLREASGDDAPVPARRSRASTAPAGASVRAADRRSRKRRKQQLSPERIAALKKQGHYLALIRRAPKAKRAGFKRIFHAKGAQAAIDALKEALGK